MGGSHCLYPLRMIDSLASFGTSEVWSIEGSYKISIPSAMFSSHAAACCCACSGLGTKFAECRPISAGKGSVFPGRWSGFKLGRPKVDAERKDGDGVFLVRAERERDGGAGEGLDNVDISVFRFTLGIPGFDDSDLPRVVGILFGGLLILNHAFSLSSITPAQWRSEVVGLTLAAVSISLPAISRQLNGTKPTSTSKPGQKQIFGLDDNLSDLQRQELAWSSYTLLRNTSSTACLIWFSGKVVCARGFWEIPSVDESERKSGPLSWLEVKLKQTSFMGIKDSVYRPTNADEQGWEVIPRGTASLVVQPFPVVANGKGGDVNQGFVLVISNWPQAYRKKDRLWIEAITKKLSEVLPQ